jgi:hypothetical protein
MESSEVHAKVREHIRSFFRGHRYEETAWTLGPGPEVLPRLRIACLSPGPKINLWAYVSVGAWEAQGEGPGGLEFLILAPAEDLRHVELVSMVAYYHLTEGLGLGHTLPIGEPWLPGSACDHFLVSLPYPLGPRLEVCPLPQGHIQVLWLLPITKAERVFKVEHGQEALERQFDETAIEYWDPKRASVV